MHRILLFAVCGWLFIATSASAARDTSALDCDPGQAITDQLDAGRRLGAMRGVSIPAPVKLPTMEVQSALRNGSYPAGSAVLLYGYREGALQAWLIDAVHIRCSRPRIMAFRDIGAAIDGLSLALQVERPRLLRAARKRTVAPPTQTMTSPKTLHGAITEVSQLLFPVELSPALKGVRNLVIVPWGAIGTTPFALLTPFGDGTNTIDHFSISIAPGVNELVKLPNDGGWNPIRRSTNAVIVGNPSFGFSQLWVVPSLKGAEGEALAVGKELGARPLIGSAASKAAVTSAAATADILYLATHGLSDPDNPLDGGLVMLSSAQLEDGWWTAREIQKSKLRARLTVLSACQTGLGLAHDGGVIGLARAFQLAGVPRVAMSLWNVDDEATRFLMTHFVRLLASKPPAQAMRLAMIEARRRYREPSLWASFAVFSTGR